MYTLVDDLYNEHCPSFLLLQIKMIGNRNEMNTNIWDNKLVNSYTMLLFKLNFSLYRNLVTIPSQQSIVVPIPTTSTSQPLVVAPIASTSSSGVDTIEAMM